MQRADPCRQLSQTHAGASAAPGGHDLRAFLGVVPPETALVPRPDGLRALQTVLAKRPAANLRTLLRWHVLSTHVSTLGQPWYGLNQTFSLRRQGLRAPNRASRKSPRRLAVSYFILCRSFMCGPLSGAHPSRHHGDGRPYQGRVRVAPAHQSLA